MLAEQIRTGLDCIADRDDDVRRALVEIGYPAPRIRKQGFETFLSIIVGQQISTGAAAAIMGRICDLLPRMEAAALLELGDDTLRRAGLSVRKVDYVRGVAQAIVDGSFNPEMLKDMEENEVIKTLTLLRGFGVWSAEIYLMFSLQRQDIFPADDLALQVALQRLKRLEHRPTPKYARSLVADWAPWRSAGSLFLWHYYRGAPG